MKFLNLSDLEGLTDEQIERKLSPFIEASFAPPNGSVDYLVGKIKEYEQAYCMSSDEMLTKISSGELQETQDFVNWAIEYDLLNNITADTDEKGCGETFANKV